MTTGSDLLTKTGGEVIKKIAVVVLEEVVEDRTDRRARETGLFCFSTTWFSLEISYSQPNLTTTEQFINSHLLKRYQAEQETKPHTSTHGLILYQYR